MLRLFVVLLVLAQGGKSVFCGISKPSCEIAPSPKGRSLCPSGSACAADWHAVTASSKLYSIPMFELLLLGMLLQGAPPLRQ